MTGEVKSYNRNKGYGFISAGGKDYRFKAQSWGLRIPPCIGIDVAFDPYETEKGLRAARIRNDERN